MNDPGFRQNEDVLNTLARFYVADEDVAGASTASVNLYKLLSHLFKQQSGARNPAVVCAIAVGQPTVTQGTVEQP